ncbi:MAG: tetratricopeptide repeat protein [Leadbetterella sp.]|nr:tetratricopeptide repeat protein [Leadbetterella sp.]
MKAGYFLVLFFLTGVKAWSQLPKTEDSLRVYLDTHPRDTSYILALNDYAFIKIRAGDFKETNALIEEMDVLCRKLDYKTGFYKVINMRGVVEYSAHNPQKAMEYFLKGQEIIEKYNLPQKTYQNSLNNIGIIYDQMGDRESATRYAVQLIVTRKRTGSAP